MNKDPAVVFVVRHGVRLDVANRTWHLSSSVPYDPPLTYGGWNQTKALGVRIASLLRMREEGRLSTGELSDEEKQNPSPRPRRQRIIIHTSPFVRCIQTSIGISAGIASTKTRPNPGDSSVIDQKLSELSLDGVTSSQQRLSNPCEQDTGAYRRPLLRVDALLGEWRNPEYFEDIVPPPNSETMVVGAKAELLRRAEAIDIRPVLPMNSGHFPGGWSRPNTSSRQIQPTRAGGPSLPLSLVFSMRERSSSHSIVEGTANSLDHVSKTQRFKDDQSAYVSPVPHYAVASTDMIPAGYVAHARDACVDVDFQWDSMRPPQDWGDGGELGEEWGAMQKRVRRGFQKMVQWYKTNGMDSKPEEQPLTFPTDGEITRNNSQGEEADDDEDVVLILVTHGAGCNSLIGALTNQPVLLDVGMASLTMATRKSYCRRPSLPMRAHTVMPDTNVELEYAQHRRPSLDLGLSTVYDMTLVASTEHLRAGGDPSRLGVPGSGASTKASSIAIAFSGEGRDAGREPRNSSLGSMRRSNTTSPGPSTLRWQAPTRSMTRTESPQRPSSAIASGAGLWSAPTTSNTTPATSATLDSESLESPINDGFSIGISATSTGPSKGDEDETDDQATALPLQTNKAAHHGLWGAGRSMPKRRWTVDQGP